MSLVLDKYDLGFLKGVGGGGEGGEGRQSEWCHIPSQIRQHKADLQSQLFGEIVEDPVFDDFINTGIFRLKSLVSDQSAAISL